MTRSARVLARTNEASNRNFIVTFWKYLCHCRYVRMEAAVWCRNNVLFFRCNLKQVVLLLQSHEIGPGPEYERVHFNLLGRSPLVSHFLKMKDLISHDQDQAKRVRRTQVAKLQYPPPFTTDVRFVRA